MDDDEIMQQGLEVGRVMATWIEAVITNHLEARRPHARVGWLYGQWLKQEADRYGLSVLPARPWNTLFERIIATVTS